MYLRYSLLYYGTWDYSKGFVTMADPNNPSGKICPQCGAVSPYTEDFCNECGARLPLETACPACSGKIPAGEKFCNSCGSPVSPPPLPSIGTSAPPLPPSPVALPNPPVVDRQQGGSKPVPGKGPRKFMIPAIIAVVIIGVLAAIILVGIPGPTTSGKATISHAFEGDWQVENSANSGNVELYRITILPDDTVTVSVPESKNVKFSATLSDGGSTLKGTLSDSATGASGPFTLALSDKYHFSGTWLVKGHSYVITGQIHGSTV